MLRNDAICSFSFNHYINMNKLHSVLVKLNILQHLKSFKLSSVRDKNVINNLPVYLYF